MKLKTEAEVSELLRISRQTLLAWRKTGKGPPWVRIEGTIRYPEADLLDWLSERRQG